MGGYNKEEVMSGLEGILNELEHLEKLLKSKKRTDIYNHEQNVIKLESNFFRLEKSLTTTTDSELAVMGRSAALKLELG